MGAISKSVSSIMNGKLLKDLGPGAWVGLGLNTYFGISTYKDAKEQGMGTIGAAAKGIGEVVMSEVVGLPTYLGTLAVTTLPKIGVQTAMSVNQAARSMSSYNRNAPFVNAQFNDTQQAFTMRQAGMQLAKASKYNLQQALLGNEAQYLHL
jgi:hypothetical protein